MFTFGDALRSTLGPYVDKSQAHMARAWSGTDDKAVVNFASPAAKAAVGSVTKEFAPSIASAPCRSDERVDIVGVGGECAVKKAARLRNITRGYPLLSQAEP